MKQRPGIDRHNYRCRIRQLRVRRQVRSLAAVDQDTDRAAIPGLAVERCKQAPVVATRLGDKAGGAGCRLVAVLQQRRGALERIDCIAVAVGYLEIDRVSLRFADDLAEVSALFRSKNLMPNSSNAKAGWPSRKPTRTVVATARKRHERNFGNKHSPMRSAPSRPTILRSRHFGTPKCYIDFARSLGTPAIGIASTRHAVCTQTASKE